MAKTVQPYEHNGVILSKNTFKTGDEVTLTYKGLLLQSGADRIFAYVGYGEAWENNGFIPMEFVQDAYRVTFKVIGKGSLNISFKDSANNWDNNSSENYIFNISTAASRKTAVKTVAEENKTEKKGGKKTAGNAEKRVEKTERKKSTVKNAVEK